MTQRIKLGQESDSPFQVLAICIHTKPNAGTFNSLTSTDFTRNNEGFSDMLDRHLRKYSKAWKELSSM